MNNQPPRPQNPYPLHLYYSKTTPSPQSISISTFVYLVTVTSNVSSKWPWAIFMCTGAIPVLRYERNYPCTFASFTAGVENPPLGTRAMSPTARLAFIVCVCVCLEITVYKLVAWRKCDRTDIRHPSPAYGLGFIIGLQKLGLKIPPQ